MRAGPIHTVSLLMVIFSDSGILLDSVPLQDRESSAHHSSPQKQKAWVSQEEKRQVRVQFP